MIGGTSLAGGRFSPAGTLVGALVIQTLTTTVYTVGIPPETTLVFKASVVIAVCLLQSPKFRALLSRRRSGPPRSTPRRIVGFTVRSLFDPDSTLNSTAGIEWPRSARTMSVRTPRGPRRHHRTPAAGTGPYLSPIASLVLFVIMFAAVGVRYDGSPPHPGLPEPVGRQLVPDRPRGRHDVRDPHRRHRPLASGSVVALSTVIVATTLQAGWPMPLAVGRCSWWGTPRADDGLVIHYFDVQPFIVTLAGMFLARGLCYVISVDSIPINDPRFGRSA